MLAHLAFPASKKNLRLLTASVLLAALASLGQEALAADMTAPGNLDVSTTGKVSDAATAPVGSISAQLRYEGTSGTVHDDRITTNDGAASTALLTKSSRASLLFGVALMKNLELTLGLHGTSEQVAPAQRDALFPGGTALWRDSLKETGFSGASLFVKLHLVDWEGFSLAVAPFAESGVGESGTYALTRSVGAKGGFVAIATYGAPGVAEVSLNAGARYRDPETVGGLALRNEQFYRAGVKAYATQTFNFFAAYEARRMTIGRYEEDSAAKRQYSPETASEISAGAGLRFSDADLSVFAARGLKSPTTFGYGDSSVGLALGWELGNYAGNRPRHSFASDIERQVDGEASAAAAAKPAKKELVGPPTPPADEIPIGKDIDPLTVVGTGEGDDFKDADARAAAYQKEPVGESEDARIERELREIKEAEAKAEVERAAQAKIDAARSQKEAAEHDREDAKLMKEWQDEAQKAAATLPGIDDDTMQWNGLDD